MLGLNRWALRVAAYAALMTDRYQPFRLDMGDTEPGALTITARGDEAAAPARVGGGAVSGAGAATIVAGSLAAVLALLLLLGGEGLLVFERTQRDASGFLMRGANTLSTDTYAVVSDQIRANGNGFDWGTGGGSRIQITTSSSTPVFVGIGPARAVDRYLARAPHQSVPDLGTTDGTTVGGNAAPLAPQTQTFWVARTSGAGHQALRWNSRDGAWRAVVMNADGSSGVTADVSVGLRLPHLMEVALGVLAAGAVLLATGATLLWAGIRRAPGSQPPASV